MNLKAKVLSSAMLLGAIVAQPAAADDAPFEQSVLDACVVEGAAEWRERMDPLTPQEEEIMALERSGCHFLASRQVDKLVEAIISDHGIILLDGAGLADGKEAQRSMFKAFLGAGYDLVYEPVDATVSASEDMAWAIGVVKVTSPEGVIEFSKYRVRPNKGT
jgi:hypothetical protein